MKISKLLPNSFFQGILILPMLLLMPFILLSQDFREQYHEAPDDAYIHVDRANMIKGASHKANGDGYFTTQANIDSNGNDMIGDAANEPSIAIDPTNPDRIVIGWRQFDTVFSNFRQAGNAYSLDGGLSWTFPGVLDPQVFRSDPVLDFDASGNLYYNSLRGTLECDVYKITDGGIDWGAPFPARGGDKQWMKIDKTNGIGAGNNYSYWNASFTTCAPGSFTRSIDGSNTFEACEEVDGNPFWGTLAVDADGTLYMVGIDGVNFIIVKSSTAKDPTVTPVTWDSVSTFDMDGLLGIGGPINPQGLLGQAWVDVDISNGPGHGNVYALASVIRTSNGDPGDVMFVRSTDGGITFEAPVRINTDNSETDYQWFGTMSVAPNGRIDVAWLDTRDASAGTNMSALYFSYSEDQGSTWSINKRLSLAFDPNIGYPQQNKMGDYMDMVSDNEGAHLAWTNTINGGQDVYYTHITPSLLGVNDFTFLDELNFKSYPNPFSEETTIEFFSNNEEHVKIEVFDILGKKQATLLDENVIGKQQLMWNGKGARGVKLDSGIYFISLYVYGSTKVSKIIIK